MRISIVVGCLEGVLVGLGKGRGFVALLLASLFFGLAAIFVRLAYSVSPLSLTFYRLGISAVVVVVAGFFTGQLRLIDRRNLVLLSFSGCMLSLHFWFFIYAVMNTSVSNATFLVNTGPVFVAVLAPLTLREKTTRWEFLSVFLAVVGVFLMGLKGEGGFYGTLGLGDLSALIAAFFVSIYTLIGRRLRQEIDVLCYVSYVYSIAALTTLGLMFVVGGALATNFSLNEFLAVLGLAIIPTVLGHTLYNYSLKEVKVVVANIFSLLEPVLASVFAFILFYESPNMTQILGYMVIIAAVVVVVLPKRVPQESSE